MSAPALRVPDDVIPPDDHDLRGKTIPTLIREVQRDWREGFRQQISALRKFFHIIDNGLWRDPQKYGGEIVNGLSYTSLGEMTDDELSWYVLGVGMHHARKWFSLAMAIGWKKLEYIPAPAIYLIPNASAAQAVADKIDGTRVLTVKEVKTAIEPFKPVRTRVRPEFTQQDRQYWEQRQAEYQRKLRDRERRIKELEHENADLTQKLGQLRESYNDLMEQWKRATGATA